LPATRNRTSMQSDAIRFFEDFEDLRTFRIALLLLSFE